MVRRLRLLGIDEAACDLGMQNPFVRSAYCPDIANWGRQRGLLDESPARGAVFLRYGTVDGVYRACHTGFVTDVEGKTFKTIEGNSNDTGSREGIGVFRLDRTNGDRYRFVHWGRIVPEPPPEKRYRLLLNGGFLFDMPVRNEKALCGVREWGERMGFAVAWDKSEGTVTFDGKPVLSEVAVISGKAYAPVRELVSSAGLKLSVDEPNGQVLVTR